MKYCANCMDICPTENRTLRTVDVYDFDTEAYTRVSVVQALHKVFKPKDNNSNARPMEQNHYFCLQCKDLFMELLEAYQQFTSLSTDGGYVYGLIKENGGAGAESFMDADLGSSGPDVVKVEPTTCPDPELDEVDYSSFFEPDGDDGGDNSLDTSDEDTDDQSNLSNEDDDDQDPDFDLGSRTKTTSNQRTKIQKSNNQCSLSTRRSKRKATSDSDAEDFDERKSLEKANQLQLFSCTVCSLGVTSKRGLTVHLKKFHPDALTKKSVEELICSICGLQFTNKRSLTLHLKKFHPGTLVSKSDGELICSICGKEFHLKRSLKKHEQVHRGEFYQNKEFRFKCEVCDARFHIKSRLERHRTCHTYERPFKCNECGSSYKSQRDLAKHEIRHRNQNFKAFVCDFCPNDNRFSERHDLSQHYRNIHKLSREEADKKAEINKHLIRVTKEAQEAYEASRIKSRSIVCGFCNKKYVVAECLARHLIKKHGVSHEQAFTMSGFDVRNTMTQTQLGLPPAETSSSSSQI